MIECQQLTVAPPAWITILAGLLTPTIALIAAYIAWQQWRTNRNKLKLDLFDRRFAVYNAARNLIGQVLAGSHANDKQIFEFLTGTREAGFLLDKDIADYLFKGLYHKASALAALHAELEGVPVGEERTKNVQSQRELRDWFLQQHDELDERFAKYLKLAH